ncbi:hypothetical protein [Sphingobium aquiterrae]|uniref:hypothetical protein n=1 Tax=Sphingobium aquiterrae TaxID=2038656 RepID=UPI00301B0CDD
MNPALPRLVATSPLAIIAALALTACSGSGQPAANNSVAVTNMTGNDMANVTAIAEDSDALTPASEAEGNASLVSDSWMGRWTGPEGLFLDIRAADDGTPGHYALTIQDTLDRKADYAGMADGKGIGFTRDGKAFSIRPGSGADTGFKYLADKKDCLIVQKGKEGYCR